MLAFRITEPIGYVSHVDLLLFSSISKLRKKIGIRHHLFPVQEEAGITGKSGKGANRICDYA